MLVGLVTTALAAGPSESVLPDDVAEVARTHANDPLPRRIEAVSGAMLGKPYTADPLGEGERRDPDPVVRYDTFDCLTYVEEVLALALSADPQGAGPIRTALRYDGTVAYGERHHFMELQWIPRALEQGWLTDTTDRYGPVSVLEKQVTPAMWANWAGRKKFTLTDDELPVGPMQLRVLGLDDAIAAADRIPVGSILLTVRVDRSWKPIWISHLGLVISDQKVRHATKMGDGGTRDHGLVWYLEHLKTYDKWPAAGVAILEPVEFGPRRARLDDVQVAAWERWAASLE